MANHLPRKLAAVLYADVAGYSRLTGEDEDTTHRRLSEYLDLVSDSIDRHQGNVIHYAGDAVLADFSTVTSALECATSYLLGQLDSAINAFKQSIARESEYLSAHTNLASIYGELGKLEEAKVPVREILRLAPDFSVKAYMKGLSFSDPEVLTRMEGGLRKAGLPE
jgi:tetratricopeptide (TPR) repeat protein